MPSIIWILLVLLKRHQTARQVHSCFSKKPTKNWHRGCTAHWTNSSVRFSTMRWGLLVCKVLEKETQTIKLSAQYVTTEIFWLKVKVNFGSFERKRTICQVHFTMVSNATARNLLRFSLAGFHGSAHTQSSSKPVLTWQPVAICLLQGHQKEPLKKFLAESIL